MSVPQYTTPTFQLTFTEPDLDLTQAANVYVTFRSRGMKMTKTGEALVVEAKSIGVKLTQQECARLDVGKIAIQANWTSSTGDRAASQIAYYDITEQLLQEVIE